MEDELVEIDTAVNPFSHLEFKLLQPLSSFELSVRTANCLHNAEIFYVRDLVIKTEAEMLRLPNLGRKSLNELRDLLSGMNLNFGMQAEDLMRFTKAAVSAEPLNGDLFLHNKFEGVDEFGVIAKFNELGLFKSVESLAFSIRTEKCLAHLNIRYAGELCSRTEGELLTVPNFGRTSVEEIKRTLHRLDLRLGMYMPAWPPENLEGIAAEFNNQAAMNDVECLKQALFRTLRKVQDERHLFILASRLGLNGPPVTLEETAQHLGLTRERVRQIQKKVTEAILKREVWDDVLRYRIAKLLSGRNIPLFLDLIGTEDTWFAGFEDNLSLLENLLYAFGSDEDLCFFSIDDRTVVSRIDFDTWRDIRFDLISMLEATLDYGHSMDDIELFVESKLTSAGAPELSSTLFDILLKDLNFSSVSGDLILVSVGNSLADHLTALLEAAPHPLHYTEIGQLYEQRFGVPISLRYVHACLGSNGFLLFGRGTYGVQKHLQIDPHLQSEMRRVIEEKLTAQMPPKQWHSKDLLPFVQSIPGAEKLDKYSVSIILKPSITLQYLGKWSWRLKSYSDDDGERLYIKHAVYSALKEAKGPVHIQDLLSLVTESRGVGQNFQLNPNELFSRVDPSIWGLLERDFLFTLPEQARIKDFVFDKLSQQGVAFHKSELLNAIESFGKPEGLTDNLILGILTSDANFKTWNGGFVGISSWAGPGRKTLIQAVQEIAFQTTMPRTADDISRQLRALIGYDFSRNAMSVYLNKSGMTFDRELACWCKS